MCRKDSAEELEERHERVHASCLLALGALLEVLSAAATSASSAAERTASSTAGINPGEQEGTGAGDEASGSNGSAGSAGPSAAAARLLSQFGEVCEGVSKVLQRPGALKTTFGSKSPLVRSASYSLLKSVAGAVQQQYSQGAGPEASSTAKGVGALLAAAEAPEVASAVLGALQDRDPNNHGALWDCVLTYIQASIVVRMVVVLGHGTCLPWATAWCYHAILILVPPGMHDSGRS
jgi:hypothetical protein